MSDTLPVGWSLRGEADETLVRFHSFPESKLHADNEDKYAIVLDHRHQVVGDYAATTPTTSS